MTGDVIELHVLRDNSWGETHSSSFPSGKSPFSQYPLSAGWSLQGTVLCASSIHFITRLLYNVDGRLGLGPGPQWVSVDMKTFGNIETGRNTLPADLS